MGPKKQWDKNLAVSMLMIVVVVVLFVAAYLQISSLMEKRALNRMEEGVNTVIEEVLAKLNRDSSLLNAAAEVISTVDSFDVETLQEAMEPIAPLLETMRMRILLPDNTVIQSDGMVLDGSQYLSYDDEVLLGEHVSNRMTSVMDGNTQVLRHFVPIVQNGETVALLYGVTRLADLPSAMNIDNIYNAKACVFIIDTETGDYIMDTWHEELGNVLRTPAGETQDGVSIPDTMRGLMSLETGHLVYKPYGSNAWQYFYYAPAGINQWAIGVSVPKQEAFANVYDVQHICWSIAAIMAVAIILYYLWIQKNAREVTAKAVERAILEEKLHKAQAAERAKTIFLSNMSHDIRTPMNAIIGFTTLAQTNLDNRERVQDYLKKILSSSNHLLSLINDILDMSRIESGKLNIAEKPCSISEIFRDMRNIIQTQMQSKQLNFFMDTVDVINENIYCDKLHLNQVLLNLLSNAIKFTPAGGSVALTIRQKSGTPTGYGDYEIRVKDTGIGMSEEFAQHIFEPFERERTSTVSGIQGTGLGMAITKSIVDAMGGTIQVETEKDKGSEFVIGLRFRLQAEDKPPEVMEELKGLRALVVDDSFSTCDSVSKMLVQIGMRAEWTLRGKEAVLRARQAIEMGDEFYVYILDWTLPDLNGMEVARQLRALVGDKAPIIVLTAYDWTVIEDEARAAGVTAFCNKPIFLSELRDVLAAAVGQCEQGKKNGFDFFDSVEELRGTRLLLVEDNELNREIAEELLTEAGFEIESAEDGTVAVEMVRNSQPGYYSLILMDIQMPIMNGYDTTRAIRVLDDPELAKIPIVAMTANAFDEDKQKALDSGMNAHVAKPIDVQKLMGVLIALLKKQ